MHPELIKAHLRIGGVTPSALADELGVDPSAVSAVIRGVGSSRRIAERISKLVGQPLEVLWPAVYGPKKPASLLRRQPQQRRAA